MASIGAVSCHFMDSTSLPPELGYRVEFWTRPGVAGHGGRSDWNNQGGPFAVRVTHIDTAANIATWLAALVALAGAGAQTITADDGVTAFTNCYVGRADGPPVTVESREGRLDGGVSKIKCVAVVHGVRSST